MIKVIDNVISKKYQDHLEETFFGLDIPWRFNNYLVDEGEGEVGFTHSLIDPYQRSEYFNYVLPLLYEISEKSEIDVSNVLFARSFLQIPSITPHKSDLFHVDVTDVEHLVFLYYLNDSDGDTVISSEKHNPSRPRWHPRENNFEILEKVTPKKGRVVVFDGWLYHAAGVPKETKRCVLNFDIVEKLLDED